MTLIIGMKYNEGIVLIGDRRVTEDFENHHFENKITACTKPFNFLVGGAGLTTLCKEFSRKIENLADFKQENTENSNLKEYMQIKAGINQNCLPQNVGNKNLWRYTPDDLVDDCLTLMKPLVEMGKLLNPNPMEVIIAVYNSTKPLLFQIYSVGWKNEDDYLAIGSGAPLTYPILKKRYKPGMKLDECIRLGTFLIKYAQKFGNAAVGIEEGRLPHIFIATNDKCNEHQPVKTDVDRILKEVDEKIKKVEETLKF